VEQPVDIPAMLVDAGPGSGKTRVLGERIRWLLEGGVDPGHIVALTFTQQAAQDLRSRLADVCPDVTAQTLHSHANSLLRHNGTAWGRTEPFQVIASLDQIRRIQKAFLDLFGWECPESHAGNLLKQISHRKRLGLEIGDHVYLFRYGHSQIEMVNVDRAYCLANRQANGLDYDDLIAEAVRGLRGDARMIESPIWLFVDEFHDISLDQYEFIRLLAPPARTGARLFTIWDRRQSIYRFRGADTQRVANSLNADYRPLLLRLSENYRSAANIVRVANALLPQGRSPELFASRSDSGQVSIVERRDEHQEAEAAVHLISRRIKTAGDAPGSIAVLYAKHERGDRIERLLAHQGINLRRVSNRSLASQGAFHGLATLLAFASGAKPDRNRLRDLSIELGPLLDEFDWLALKVDETGRVSLREETGPSDSGLRERVRRFNQLLDRVDAIPDDLPIKQLGDAVIEIMARSQLPLTAEEITDMVDVLKSSVPKDDPDPLRDRARAIACEAIPSRCYVAVDIEATSKYPDTAEIFDIAAIRFDAAGTRIGESFQAVIRDVRVPNAIKNLTRITQQELDAGIDVRDALSQLRVWVRPDDVLVGHALANFDVPVINRQLRELGFAVLDNEILDTLPLARRLYPNQSRRLEDLCVSLGFIERQHHRALPDVEANIDLFVRIVEDRRWRVAITTVAEEARLSPSASAFWEQVRQQWHRAIDLTKSGHTLTHVLSTLALTNDDARCTDSDAVQLMTIHASKGLEWDTVILVGIEDDLFPFGVNRSRDDFEEARRLLFVGMTRAKDRLAIFHVQHRDGVPKIASRFLENLPKDSEIVYRKRLFRGPSTGRI
jgi:superfamily I DNA/RNA helicase